MAKPVIKVAKKGKNADSTEEKDLNINSTKNHLKVFAKYTLTLDEEA